MVIIIKGHEVQDKVIIGKIEAMTKDDLPDEYLNTFPHLYKEGKDLKIYDFDGRIFILRDGTLIDKSFYSSLSILITICGAKLKYLDKIKNPDFVEDKIFCTRIEENKDNSRNKTYIW